MAKAGLLFVGTEDGLVLFSDPGGTGRWLRVGHTLRGQPVPAVWAESDNPLCVLAGAGTTLQRSDDGGRSWSSALDQQAAALIGTRESPRVVRLITATGQVYSSDDAGLNWTILPEPASAPRATVVRLAGRAEVQLAAQAEGGIGRSTDHGATWAATEADAAWQGPVTVIVPASYHIDTAFAGSAGGQIAISSDRGRTWRMIKQDLPAVRSIAAARLA